MQPFNKPRRGTARSLPLALIAPLALTAPLLLLAGCPATQPDGPDSVPTSPLDGSEVTLTVVNDPAIARSAERLRGEWSEQTGGRFHVAEVTPDALFAAAVMPGDAVILPSSLLGAVAEREWLGVLPADAQPANTAADPPANRSAVFEALRRGEAVWGTNVVAVPFGSPVFVCYYRADLLEQLNLSPPRTWDEYASVARQLTDAVPDTESWSAVVEPLGPGWAGLVLLARAAAYAKHRENYSVWFDMNTMAPLIAGPPFVRAMEELVEAAKLGGVESLELDPDGARRAFWSGRAGMVLSWPTAAADIAPGPDASFSVGFAELPGSMKVYNVSRNRWDDRAEGECPQVPLLGIAGRLGVIRHDSANPEAAMALLCWLSGNQWSPTVCAKSPATTLFRQEHLAGPSKWVESPISPEAAAQYAATAERSLGRGWWVTALRIPGRDAYLAALDQAVHSAVRGEATAQEALDTAAATWRATTDSLGLDRQKTAYRRSLELE
ncbi:MAG: extracellular solute-binding protein [Patescibacteria group bacterium]|nr:extracellular solute-binding protein [Patescibacteria group bacterium]